MPDSKVLPLRRKRPEKMAYTVRIDLKEAKPPIWRRIQLASDMPLPQVRDVMLAAMGWSGYHLHQFSTGSHVTRDYEVFLTPWMVEEGEIGVLEADLRLDQALQQPGDKLGLDYDFGDGWRHSIKLEKVEPWQAGMPEAVCVRGRRACPPEDVGGIWGLERVLKAFDDGLFEGVDFEDPETEELLDWLPFDYDPTYFSVDETNENIEEALTGEFFTPLPGW